MASNTAARFSGHYPYRPAIDAYGNGGFRFADMSHRGSILIVGSGVYAWEPTVAEELTVDAFQRAIGETGRIGFILLGTGRGQVFPSLPIRQAFAAARLGLDVMDTGAAARTYNILLAEGRPVGAALLAVD